MDTEMELIAEMAGDSIYLRDPQRNPSLSFLK